MTLFLPLGLSIVITMTLMLAILILIRIYTAQCTLDKIQIEMNNQLRVIHAEVNSRLTLLLQQSSAAGELIGRAAERAERLADQALNRLQDNDRREERG